MAKIFKVSGYLVDAETYSTPEEAEEGHRQMIEKWKEMEIDEY